MTSSEIVCVVGLLLVIISKTILAYDGIQVEAGSHGISAANDYLPEEPRLQQWSVQSMSPPGCPEQCSCKKNDIHHIINVDCSSRELTIVPDLPQTTIILSLENNSISNIPCDSFKHLQSLQDLNLAYNNISQLLPCVFQSQSVSDNNIDYLDVKLFQDLSQLQTLNLSNNVITYLANRTFSDLSQLLLLNLSFNSINTIDSDAFKGLRSLKSLSLLSNSLHNYTSFHKDVFQDFVALETLNVKGNEGLLDDALSPLRNLSHLYMDLDDYRIALPALGTGFRQLTNLQVLDFSPALFTSRKSYIRWTYCTKKTVPSHFFNNIRTGKSFELYMSLCDVREIADDAFAALRTLVTLDLSHNKLINFWEQRQIWMASLINTQITSLDLSCTRHSVLPNRIPYLWFKDLARTNLKMLSLQRNSISYIHLDYFHPYPATIEKLDLSENYLYLDVLYISYDHAIINNFKLRELYINDQQEIPDANIVEHVSSGCGLFYEGPVGARGTSVQSELSDSDRVNSSQILNISTNKKVDLRRVDKDMNKFLNTYLSNSESLVINISLPDYLEAIYARSAFRPNEKSIGHIRIIGNTVLSRVDLTGNLLTTWLGPVENVPNLSFLKLSNNHCEYVDVNFFKYMVGLEMLILRENIIGPSLAQDISGLIFSTLTNLTVLDLSQNVIQDLSRLAFLKNANLEILDLSYNRLTEFQPTLSTIRNMSFLDLSSNLLPGLSEQTCHELELLKSRNKSFTVNLLNNRLLFTCDYLPFLDLLISNPQIFLSVENLEFRYVNGTKLFDKNLAHQFPTLARECLVQRYFIVILIIFFIVVGTLTFCAVLYHKRWKLRYLYYIGHRRMHIGEHLVEYVPAADVFITYDQEDLRWRRFMQQTFLPGLNQRNITYILGETDFPGGDVMAHITGAVVGTRKTVVLLSMDIFDDHHREFEMNLAIMREMDTRGLRIVPIFVEDVDLALYPQEIEIFLRNQWERCLNYSSTDDFWDDFVDAVRENN